MTSKQEVQNRRLLEEIQQQKRQLMLKNARPPTNPPKSAVPDPKSNSELSEIQQWATFGSTTPQGAPITHQQGPAMLRAAEAQCFGHFVTSNSSYGNVLIPAVPRIDQPPQPASQSTSQPT